MGLTVRAGSDTIYAGKENVQGCLVRKNHQILSAPGARQGFVFSLSSGSCCSTCHRSHQGTGKGFSYGSSLATCAGSWHFSFAGSSAASSHGTLPVSSLGSLHGTSFVFSSPTSGFSTRGSCHPRGGRRPHGDGHPAYPRAVQNGGCTDD